MVVSTALHHEADEPEPVRGRQRAGLTPGRRQTLDSPATHASKDPQTN
jgi:hypothetical protein